MRQAKKKANNKSKTAQANAGKKGGAAEIEMGQPQPARKKKK